MHIVKRFHVIIYYRQGQGIAEDLGANEEEERSRLWAGNAQPVFHHRDRVSISRFERTCVFKPMQAGTEQPVNIEDFGSPWKGESEDCGWSNEEVGRC